MKNTRLESQTSEKVYSSGHKKNQNRFQEFGPYYNHTASTIRSAFIPNRMSNYSNVPQNPNSSKNGSEFHQYGKNPPFNPYQYGSAHHIRRDQRMHDPRFLNQNQFQQRQNPPPPQHMNDMRYNSDKHIQHNRGEFNHLQGSGRKKSGFGRQMMQNPQFGNNGYYPPPHAYDQRNQMPGPQRDQYNNFNPNQYDPQNYSFHPQNGNQQNFNQNNFYPPQNYPEFRSERRLMDRRNNMLPPPQGQFYPQRDMRNYGSDMNIRGNPQNQDDYYYYNYHNQQGHGQFSRGRHPFPREDERNHFRINEFMEGEEEHEEDNELRRADVPF